MKLPSIGITKTILKLKDKKRRKLAGKYLPYYLDDLSKGLIEARLSLCANNKLCMLLANYIKLGYDNWEIPELEQYGAGTIFYLFGEGDGYEYCELLLKHSKYSGRFRAIGTDIAVWEAAGSDAVLLPSQSMKELEEKYPQRLVHVNSYGLIPIGQVGWQYFDMFSPKKDEVFVNAGAFQGETDIDFAKWTNNSYKKIFAFEPMQSNVEICRKRYAENGIENIDLFGKGTWSENGHISFAEGANQGQIDANGTNCIETIKIDDAVIGYNGRITFIKMDIEGAELEALRGARETIQKNKPRMAICIYHKPEDLYEIPGYLLSLVPEYRFKVRQYTSTSWETVLYAAVEGEW